MWVKREIENVGRDRRMKMRSTMCEGNGKQNLGFYDPFATNRRAVGRD